MDWGRRRLLAVVSGLAAMLVSWILVMPPSAGLDEFEHIFRAASVARGEWVASPDGGARGDAVAVPSDIVAAARPQCQRMDYTSDQDCVGIPDGPDRRVVSTAANYHPAFYFVVGSLARFFHGTYALYAMRLATAALALLFVGLALMALGTWARTRAALLSVVVGCTPMVLYSSAIVAPNGVEMTSALAFWIALVGLLVADESKVRRLSAVASISGATLCTLRSLGPVWCLLIAVTILVAVNGRPGRARALTRRWDVILAAALIALSALQSIAWVLWRGTLPLGSVAASGPSGHTSLGHRTAETAMAVPVWLLQTIAAFPQRNATHPAVYACYLGVFVVVMVIACRVSPRRLVLGVGFTILVGLAVPVVITMRTQDSLGGVLWQGRYSLPFLVGLVVLGAYALDRAGIELHGPWPALCGVLYVAAQVVSLVSTLHSEMGSSPLVHSSAWLRPPEWLVVVFAGLAAVLVWWPTLPSGGVPAVADGEMHATPKEPVSPPP